MLSSALIAGFAVGLLAALLQYTFVEKLILLAERYESHELVHFQGVAEMAPGVAMADSMPGMDMSSTDEAGPAPLVRHALSVLFAGVIYIGYSLVMVAGFALAARFGHSIGTMEGLLWGLAGFLAFQMFPALGLQPDLPGTPAAPLEPRQMWWAGCALATVAGLGLLAYGKGVVPRLAALALLTAPHMVGAPELGSYGGVTPPELAASFAARSLAVGLIAWVTLGGLSARLWSATPA
jgi:cobalt transporter subunit CbtA